MSDPFWNRHIFKLDTDQVHFDQIDPSTLDKQATLSQAGNHCDSADDSPHLLRHDPDQSINPDMRANLDSVGDTKQNHPGRYGESQFLRPHHPLAKAEAQDNFDKDQ